MLFLLGLVWAAPAPQPAPAPTPPMHSEQLEWRQPETPLQLSEAYDRPNRIAETALWVGIAGPPVVFAGGILVFAGALSNDDVPLALGATLALGGGIAAIGGPIVSLASARHGAIIARRAGATVNRTPETIGWISVAGMALSLALPPLIVPSYVVTLVASGMQIRNNRRAVKGHNVRHLKPKPTTTFSAWLVRDGKKSRPVFGAVGRF